MKLRTTIAVLLVLIFALVTIPTFFIRSFVNTYLNPTFYQGQVVEESHDYLVSFLQDQVKEDELISEYFKDEDIEKLITDYFPIESLQEVVQDFITQLNNLSEGRLANDISISLMPLKQRIPDMAGEVANHIAEQIPYCEEGTDLVVEEINMDNGLPTCIPVEVEISSIENPLKRELEKNLNDLIPGEFSLDLENGENAKTNEFKQLLFVFKYAQMILPLFLIIVLLLMALIIYKPYTKTIKFIGSSFALGGIFSVVAGQLFLQLPTSAITSANFPDFLVEELNKMVVFYTFLIQFIVDKINTYSIFFIGIGALFILIGFYLSHYYEKHPHITN